MLIVLLCALFLDYFLGEPSEYHPLVLFGQFATWLEEKLNEALLNIKAESNVDLSSEFISETTDKITLDSDLQTAKNQISQQNRINGLIAALLCIVPITWLVYSLDSDGIIGFVLEVVILYFAIGLNSLKQHAQDVLTPLMGRQYEQARQALSKIVSRDTQDMDEEAICRATTESVLENGNDAVFATIFWFVIAGAPGVIVFRLSNTLDAMWGYKTDRYNNFGYFIAKFDDILNYIPARLTALTYAMMGNWNAAIRCWSAQGSLWESKNAGSVMAAGAGALDVQLGGADQYHGELKNRPDLGCGQPAKPEVIHQACELLDRSTVLWIIVVALITIPGWL